MAEGDFEVHPVGTARELAGLRQLHRELMAIDEGEEFELLSAEFVRRAQRDAAAMQREIDGGE